MRTETESTLLVAQTENYAFSRDVTSVQSQRTHQGKNTSHEISSKILIHCLCSTSLYVCTKLGGGEGGRKFNELGWRKIRNAKFLGVAQACKAIV